MKKKTYLNIFKTAIKNPNRNQFELYNLKTTLTTPQNNDCSKKNIKIKYTTYCFSSKKQNPSLNISKIKKEINLNNHLKNSNSSFSKLTENSSYSNFLSKNNILNKLKHNATKRKKIFFIHLKNDKALISNDNQKLFNKINKVHLKQKSSKVKTTSINYLNNNKNVFNHFSTPNHKNKYNNNLFSSKKNSIKTKTQKKKNYSICGLIKKINYQKKPKNPKSELIRKNNISYFHSRLSTNKSKTNRSRNINPHHKLRSLMSNNLNSINENFSIADFQKVNNFNMLENNDESFLGSKMINYNLGEISETSFSSKLSLQMMNIKQIPYLHNEMGKKTEQKSKEEKEFFELNTNKNSKKQVNKKLINVDNLEKIEENDNNKLVEDDDILCHDIEEYKEGEKNKNIVNVFLK